MSNLLDKNFFVSVPSVPLGLPLSATIRPALHVATNERESGE
jgi:hypothetical protein